MRRYVLRAFAGQLRRGKTLFLLSVVGVAIGVGSVLSIQIINRNALSAFRGSVKAVTGDADLSVVSRTPTLDESLFPRVLGTRGVAAAWPLVRVLAAVHDDVDPDGDALFLEVIGVDLFGSARTPTLETTSPGESGDGFVSLDDVLTLRGWVAVSPSLADERGWSLGDTIPVSSGARRTELVVGARVDFQKYSPFASRKLALMDIAQVQSLFGRRGQIQEIQIQLSQGYSQERVAMELQETLGSEALVLTPQAREAKVQGLLEAFRLNLTALSLISLFVGVFLIYSATQTSLVRRRPEFGLLRSMGATRAQILGIILSEILLLGVLGTALGLPLGYLAAQLNVDKVSATLTSIYLLNEIERLELDLVMYLLAAGVGIGGALLGAIIPALDMSRRDTRTLLVSFTLREKVTHLAPRLAGVGTALIAAIVLWYLAAGRDLKSSGFVLSFLLLVCLPMLTPQLILSTCGHIRPNGLGFPYSLKTLALKVQTTAFAVASLGIAVSMLIGVTLLIGSFRFTLDTWLETSIQADVYITTESWAREGQLATMTPELLHDLEGHPGVASTEVLRQFWVYSGDRRISLSGVRFDREARVHAFPLFRGDPDEIWRRLPEGAVIIGEPLSRKLSLGVGDSLTVAAPGGDVSFPIVGVTYDYSEAGSALIELGVMESIFGSAAINNVALYVDEGRDVETFVDDLRARFEGFPLIIRSNRELRAEVMHIFDQTFAITRLLQMMALLVAAAGVSLTLLVLARERIAELALYRALGALRRQIFRIFVGEGLAIGVLGLMLGVGGGFALAAILIYVINPAYFGWTIRPSLPWMEIGQEAITILVVATVSGIYPAVRASRMPVAELSRDDL